MKKLGLCVRYDCNNYGSMLQIYATQKAINKVGWDYEIIRYDKKNFLFVLKNITRVFNPYFMKGKILGYKKNLKMRACPDVYSENQKRLNEFSAFRKKYIGPYSPVFKGEKALKAGTKNYDAIMVGSDQLWTPAGLKTGFFNLMFVPDQMRKIAFATSFGIRKVPGNQRKLTRDFLKRIDYLSVREQDGADIIRELTGKEALVALDPTMLFTGDDWNSMIPAEPIMERPYIFAYFLGTSEAHRTMVKKLSEDTGLPIVTCPHLDEFVEVDLTFGDVKCFQTDPADFLNLIRNAEYICTDSFHGTVFSILFHKRFVTFNRYVDKIRSSKNNRIDNLFHLLGLEDRHVTKEEASLGEILDDTIDYSDVDKKLSLLREESWTFLMQALHE